MTTKESKREEVTELAGGHDDTLLIASDDGRIYRVVRERWARPEFEIKSGPVHDKLKALLDVGVAVAKLPVDAAVEPFFTCNLLNLAALRPTAPKKT